MNELKNEFIRRSTAELEEIRRQLNSLPDGNLSDNFLREIFRKLHTIKGTAQVFKFPVSAKLAHALENLISGTGEKPDPSAVTENPEPNAFLSEGISILEASLQKDDFQIPAHFAEKLPDFNLAPAASATAENALPAEIIARLSGDEKKQLNLLHAQNRDLIVLEIGFSISEFAGKFRAMRQQLEEKGEIIAALSEAKFAAENKIGFQIIFAAKNFSEELISDTGAEIIFRTPQQLSDDLQGVLANIAAHGKTLAQKLEKNCEFVVSAEPLDLSAKKLKLIFDIFLHLVRNAIDHGIRKKGIIEIGVKRERGGLLLTIGDDGSGININKIHSAAAVQNLIETDQQLPDQEIINLIFAPGLTTAEKLSEISGRGTGLDAVKTLVESAGGTIEVKNAEGRGAIFEIFLPEEISTE